MVDKMSAFACLHNIRNQFGNVENTEELRSCVKEIFPLNETEYNIVMVKGNISKFKTTVECDLKSELDIENFIQQYQKRTNETLRKRTPSKPSEKSEFSCFYYFRCHHKTHHQPTMNPSQVLNMKPSKRLKNTDCPFSLSIKLKRVPFTEYSCIIEIEWNHNHTITGLQALTFKDIPSELSLRIKDMFETQGFTPGLAYRQFIKGVRNESINNDDFQMKFADRSLTPRRRDFNQLYTEFKKEKYGSKDLSTMFKTLKTVIDKINNSTDKETGEHTFKFNEFNASENDPFILVIITPLMKRVHEMVSNSGDIVFLDASGGMEEYDLRVFVMVTYCVAGALPLGIFITSDETTDTLVQALDLFKECLPNNAFANKGVCVGPSVIMTDNCSELRDALQTAWPAAILLLCTFHLLQQVWRWLFDLKHGIVSSVRPLIMQMFRKVVLADTEDYMDELYAEMIEDPVIQKYQNLINYLTDLYDIRQAWAQCYRQKLRIRGNQTNNACESQFLVIKDEILNRTKEININGLIHKLVYDFNDHFKTKLLCIAVGKFDGCYGRRFKGIEKKKEEGLGFLIPPYELQKMALNSITKLGDNLFKFPSFSSLDVEYLVDMSIGVCQCKRGMDGSVCKHQYILWTFEVSKNAQFLPYLDSKERQRYAQIANGNSMEIEYYEGIHDRVRQSGCDLIHNHDVGVDFESQVSEHQYDETLTSCESENTAPLRINLETISIEEIKQNLRRATNFLEERLDNHPNDRNLAQGLVKFCDRVIKFPVSRLSSAMHNFGVSSVSNLKVTNS